MTEDATMPTPRTWMTAAVALALLAAPLAGCSGGSKNAEKDDAAVQRALEGGERYSSAQVQGATARINLDAVRKAFETTQGGDMNAWMGAFERRVNEIYEGSETVAIDAARKDGQVVVAGFIERNGTGGFQQGDDRLFVIEQTGAAANNQVPYRVANHDGQTYYQGSSGFGGMGTFMMGMMAGQLMSNWGGYHTPRSHYSTLSSHRTSYRNTPSYQSQVRQNTSFASRFKAKAAGGVQSNRSFGQGGVSQGGTTSRRTWGGTTGGSTGADASTSGTKSSGSSWGGRRSSSSAESGSSSSSTGGWGGRRSSSSSSSSSSRRSSGRRR